MGTPLGAGPAPGGAPGMMPPGGMDPMGGPGGMGAPPSGAPPMGGPGGMGGDPMGGMGGGMPPGGAAAQIPVKMKDADVWTVLKKLLDKPGQGSNQDNPVVKQQPGNLPTKSILS